MLLCAPPQIYLNVHVQYTTCTSIARRYPPQVVSFGSNFFFSILTWFARPFSDGIPCTTTKRSADSKSNAGFPTRDPGNVRAPHVCDNGHRHLRRNPREGREGVGGGSPPPSSSAEELPETAVIHCRLNDAFAHAVLIAVA